SEQLSDMLDPAIKYGGGPNEVQGMLAGASEMIRRLEDAEAELAAFEENIADLASRATPETRGQSLQQLRDMRHELVEVRDLAIQQLTKVITAAREVRERRPT